MKSKSQYFQGIDKNTYLKVQYLPHTKYGAIVENK